MSNDEQYKPIDLIWDIGCSFDVISPILQWIGDLGGLVTVEGTRAEIYALKKKGIKTYNEMAIIGSAGGYLWQIHKRDLKRAQKVLGGRA